MLREKMFYVHQKNVHVTQKSVSCRQKQDDAAQKNILYSKNLLFFPRTAHHTLIFQQNFYISTYRLKNVFASLQSINFVVRIRSSDQLKRIITLENLKVPLKMSLGRSHVKMHISSSHEWIR